MIKFYDTCALLELQEKAFENKFLISSITLEELENIKTSAHKDNDLKYAARGVTRLLATLTSSYEVIPYKKHYSWKLAFYGHEITNDMKILSCAMKYKDCEFVTADLSFYLIAKNFIQANLLREYLNQKPEYTGYTTLKLSDEEIAELYMPNPTNKYDLFTNEYIIVKNYKREVIDLLCWDGTGYRHIDDSPINSKFFGKIQAYKGDIYQKFALDSLRSHQLTVLRGRSGSGKSYLGLTYLFSLLEKGEINKIVIFANPAPVKGAIQLGLYPGSANDKLLDAQTGNFLTSKFGDSNVVQDLVEKGKIVLMPAVDIRGVSISPNSAVYFTEAQNATKEIMKLMLQRIEEGTKVVIEGDELQTDLAIYEGKNNGLKRLSEVFRGKSLYSEVKLQNNYRSEIANIAEEM